VIDLCDALEQRLHHGHHRADGPRLLCDLCGDEKEYALHLLASFLDVGRLAREASYELVI
jgi:hypothetical protein